MTTYFVGIFAPLKGFDKFIPSPYEPIPLEYRHLTLVYLGPLKHLGCTKGFFSRAPPTPKFKLLFQGIEPYPSMAKPRYLAAKPDKASTKQLYDLRVRILSCMKGTAVDKYETFRPHVSIAYVRAKFSLDLIRCVQRAIKESESVKESLVVEKISLIRAEAGKFLEIAYLSLTA